MFICDVSDEYLPRRGTLNSAGYDFFATEDIIIKPGEWTNVDTHVRLAPNSMSNSQVMLIFPRSSTGFKYGLRLRNTSGVIDADYTDNIHAMLTADEEITIKKGDKYMQGVIVYFGILPGEIPPIAKRVGGIGSTGN
jgi:dUTP pyrophosphatase